MNFLDLINAPQPAPMRMPPAEGGPVNAAQVWQDAISGRGPQFVDIVDRNAAAQTWHQAIEKVQPQAGLDIQHVEAKRLSARGLVDRSGEWGTEAYGFTTENERGKVLSNRAAKENADAVAIQNLAQHVRTELDAKRAGKASK